MDFAARDFLLTWRRLLAALVMVTLLVSFWADRPTAAASMPQVPAETRRAFDPRVAADAKPRELTPTAIISTVRRPWLAFYTAVGAPDLQHGPSPAEEGQFRSAVGRLAFGFFVLAAVLWVLGHRAIKSAAKL